MSTIAIIPARGGSKGIPRKNLALVGGAPLVVHSIRAGLGCPAVDAVIVSTDDEEIANVAVKAGAEVVWRPDELARDDSPTEPCILHVMDDWQSRQGKDPDWVVLLQPTSPLRDSNDIEHALKILHESKADAVLSVFERREFRWKAQGIFGIPGWDIQNRPRRQELDPDYVENGALYVTRSEIYRIHCNRLGGKIALSVMPPERSIDVDEPFDLWLVERMFEQERNQHERA